MIFDRIENAKIYSGINEGINKALEFAKTLTPDNFGSEILRLDGDRIFINFASYETHARSVASSEAHKKYIDVMYMVEGCETVYVKNAKALTNITKEYDAQKDVLFADLDDDVTPVRLDAGSFLILFPEDAHSPGCDPLDATAVSVKKIIGKVLL